MGQKRILVLNTGGTFSSVKGSGGVKPGLGRKNILENLMPVAKECRLDFEDMYSLDSANIAPKQWKCMAERIEKAAEDYDGIVVIHGTDTMAYTSSMLSFMLKGIPVPLVVTGSQLSIAHPVADAMENSRAAVYMAASGHPGVYVAFNRKIILGTRASKVHTMSFDAFESINYPYAAVINAYGMEVNERIIPPKEISEKFAADTRYSDKVALIKVIPGMRPEIFSLLPEMGYKGVVIEAFGLGGLPFGGDTDWCKAAGAMTEAGMAVVVGSQCRYGGSSLEVYETGKRALKSGAVQMYDMTTEAAVTKLMWLLGHEISMEEVKEQFLTPMCGEISDR